MGLKRTYCDCWCWLLIVDAVPLTWLLPDTLGFMFCGWVLLINFDRWNGWQVEVQGTALWCWMCKVCSEVLKVCTVVVWMRMWKNGTHYILNSVGGSILWCDGRFTIMVSVTSTVVKWVCVFWPVSGCSQTILCSSLLQPWRTYFSQCRVVNAALEPVTRIVWLLNCCPWAHYLFCVPEVTSLTYVYLTSVIGQEMK